MPEVTKKDIEILKKQDVETLADWWCRFNSWEWVNEFDDPETKSDRWDSRTGGRAWKIMCLIEGKIGDREISKCWNTKRPNSHMTEEEWIIWYTKHGWEKI